MKLTVVAISLAVLLQAALVLPMTQQVPARGSIEGVVTRAGSGDPIPGARVNLTRSGPAGVPSPPKLIGDTLVPVTVNYTSSSASPSTVTDGAGRFVFKDLDAGSYRIAAGANGYAKSEYGQHVSSGQGSPISLNSGQTIRDVGISLTQAGNITGRIRDNTGQPGVGVQVQLLKVLYNANGSKTYQSAGTARSDDRGEYRLYWITPGRYYLLASNGSNPIISGTTPGSPNEISGEVVPPTFYPGTGDIAQAAIVEVKPGTELGGVDIIVNRQSAYRIRGRVIDGGNGRVPSGVNITLVTPSLIGSTYNAASSQSYNLQDGTFELRDVSSGPHIIRAQTMPSSVLVTPGTSGTISTAGAGSISLNVNSDMDGVVLPLSSVVSLTGQLSIEGILPPGSPGLNLYRVQLRPSMDGVLATNLGGPTPISQTATAEGAFRIDTVLPGEYRLSVSPLPADMYVKQARFNQTDVLNKPMQLAVSDSGVLDVVLSSRGGQIDGVVTDGKQHAAAGIQAVLIPDRTRDRIDLYKNATTDASGRYSFHGIAPGDYRVFAWEAIDPYAYFDPDLLKQDETKGKPVHISESSKESVDVKVISAEQ